MAHTFNSSTGRQKNLREFKASLAYRMTAKATETLSSKMQNQNKKLTKAKTNQSKKTNTIRHRMLS